MIKRHPAFNPSINAFFNALIQELGFVEYRPSHQDPAYGCFAIRNDATGESLLVPCLTHSATGHHTLGATLSVETANQLAPLDLPAAVDWCLCLPAIVACSSCASRKAFRDRVINSDRNLKHFFVRNGDRMTSFLTRPFDFIAAEQALIHGHQTHPCPKDRGSMTTSEAISYAPEFGGRFPLAWYSVDHRHLVRHQGGRQSIDTMIADILDNGGSRTLLAHLPGHSLVPCHPLQHHQWQADPGIRRLQSRGRIRFIGMGRAQWQSTSSMQTVWSAHQDWMLTFGLTASLPGNTRPLDPESARQGTDLRRLLDRKPLRAWLRSHPELRVIKETAALTLCDDAGNELAGTSLSFQDNPFCGSAAENAESLATLLQVDPATGGSRLARKLAEHQTSGRLWFHRYLDTVADPVLDAQSQFGLLFAASARNLVLKLDQNFMPAATWLRDQHETRFTSTACRHIASQAGGLFGPAGTEAVDEQNIRLFCHDLFVDSTFGIIAALARAGLCHEGELLAVLRRWLTLHSKVALADKRAIAYVLGSPCLFARSTVMPGLLDASADTGALCHPVANPLLKNQAGPMRRVRKPGLVRQQPQAWLRHAVG